MHSIKSTTLIGLVLCSCAVFASCDTEMATVGQHSNAKPILRSIRSMFQGPIVVDSPVTDNLEPIFPNPFNSGLGDSVITIKFEIQKEAAVKLIIQNPLGDSIAVFQDAILSAGSYAGNFGMRNSNNELLSEGLYFITLRIEDRGFIDSRLFLIEAN